MSRGTGVRCSSCPAAATASTGDKWQTILKSFYSRHNNGNENLFMLIHWPRVIRPHSGYRGGYMHPTIIHTMSKLPFCSFSSPSLAHAMGKCLHRSILWVTTVMYAYRERSHTAATGIVVVPLWPLALLAQAQAQLAHRRSVPR